MGAGVSPGTVYNYFGTKNAILAAVVTGEMDGLLTDTGIGLDLESRDPVDVLMPVLEAYLNTMTAHGPYLLRELLRAGFDPAQTELLAGLVSSDERVLVQLSESLREMRAKNLLSSAVDVDIAALLVYSIVAVALIMFASVPGTEPDDVTAACRVQLRTAFDGLAALQVAAAAG